MEAGEYYLVQVAATGIDGTEGEFSAPIRARALSGATFPSAVARPDLIAVIGTSQIIVEWDSPTKPSGTHLTRYELRLYVESADGYTYFTRTVELDSQLNPPATNTTTLVVPSNNETYRVAVRAFIDPGGYGEWSPEASITLVPAPGEISPVDDYPPSRPGALTLLIDDTDPSNPEIGVSWSKPSTGATNPITSYEIHQATHLDPTGRSFNFQPQNDNAQQSATIKGLPTRVRYTYRLRAHNKSGASAWSPTAQIYLPDSDGNLTPVPTAVPTPVGFLPGRPTDLRAWGLTDIIDRSFVRFYWDAPDSDGNRRIQRYMVRYRASGQDWTEVNARRQHQFRIEHPDAVYRTRYEFQVAAVNSVGQGSWSSSVYATPLKAPDVPDPVTIVAGNGELRVRWTRPESNDRGITHYVLFYSTADNSSSDMIERITGTSYTIRNLTNGTEYKVAISAISSAGESGWSVYTYATPG